MIISNVQNAASYAVAPKQGSTGSSFQTTLAETTSNTSGTTASSSSSTTASSDPAVKTFMDYMKKTPGERMFDSWLSSQKITPDQFKAMNPADQQKLLAAFKEYMKQKMTENTNTGASSGSVDIMA